MNGIRLFFNVLVYNVLTDIKNDEIKRFDKHLKYKVDPNKVACIKFL